MKTILKTLFIVILFTSYLFAQVPKQFLAKSKKTPVEFNPVSKKLGHYTAEDWASAIDTTWGDGLSTEAKLEIFDEAWNILNTEFPVFYGLNMNIMDSLKNLYRPEIAEGVSRGRFAAIMNHFSLAFKESHTVILDIPVNSTPLEPGVPLFVISPMTDNSHFGATLTPLPDSSLLVIKAFPNHPLGLVPGDIVLGYDNVPWKVLYHEILAAQLPLFPGFLPKTT